MRAPRHYLLLVVYLHSSLKEKRETQISLTNSLFFSSSVLSLFIKKSLFCSSLFSVSFLQFFVKKMQIPLFSKTCKKNSPPQLRDRRKKEKRRKKNLQRIDFSETRLLSRNSLQKKSSKRRACLHTHACTHTHFCLSLSICKLSEHCCCCCCCCELGVFSSSLSLSFLVRKKKGEEKRKTTEDHPKTVQRGGSNPRERDQISNVLIFLQEDVKEDSLRESKRGYTHLLIPLRVFATVWNDFKSDTTT